MHLPLARPRSPAAQCTVGTASLSVIIPAYDEAERLPRTLEESLAHLSTTRRGPWEIIVVDDGSHDSTCELVAARLAAEPRLRLLSSGRGANRGKGAGLAAGAAAARGELLLLLDATPLSALPALERRVGARGCEMAVGCRAAALAARPAARRLMGVVFAALASTCVRGVPDTQCGFKLLSRRAARELFPSLQIRGWAYDATAASTAVAKVPKETGLPYAEMGAAGLCRLWDRAADPTQQTDLCARPEAAGVVRGLLRVLREHLEERLPGHPALTAHWFKRRLNSSLSHAAQPDPSRLPHDPSRLPACIKNVLGPLWRTCDTICGHDNKDPNRESAAGAAKAVVTLTFRPIKSEGKYRKAFAQYATTVQASTPGVRAFFSFMDKSREKTALQASNRPPPPLFDFKPQELFEHAPGIKHRLVPEWYAKRQQQQS
ncbi:hypothetical protein EMIHUDRAFT_123131 [Emiliania huxleyi CCMP1516]|uniref:Glycosyltransferase 2-like domain-containing protein n=2 Tax=Emiliania huxleyi TaxID=2903 RepID=A0A0D3K441_EMIH1|nr:hypothetical protein EMIHUDRAFT_123131 [Emiliania huxleyi CCMP1516]EOD30526.1 hypothetical protein EMIHUDRAFT_123131 [Emiliania huxleyi CCMP1516]|eukprot:XP_005782955.1 hypothetical protein EMIHUDRAFT_123131 [Emiliania huxleyi CCMP1516]